MRDDLRRLRRFAQRLPPHDPEAPVPPPLPPARVLTVPERGEVFHRLAAGPAGAVPVLLLHGWTASADLNWFQAYDGLAARHLVVAPDHRGHGRGIRAERPFSLEDCADDAAGLLEALDLPPAVVVGYSMGGPIGLLLWQRHPARVAGLVLEATALEWRESWYERLVWRTMALFELSLRAGTGQGLVERGLRVAIEDEPELAPWRPWLVGEFRRGDPRDIAEAGRALGRFDARPFAHGVDVPTAVVVTTRDRLVRPRKQRALAAATRARVFELAADHDAFFVQGRRLADLTVSAVESVLEARH